MAAVSYSSGFVYDLGANRGANIPYYLRQGFRVIAVDANPKVCAEISRQYGGDPRVVVVNSCVVSRPVDSVLFYVHAELDKLSTAVPPLLNEREFDTITIDARTPASLFSEYGIPHYVKIDLEGLDGQIIEAMHTSGNLPPYISAEVHSIDVLFQLMTAGYREFKVVEGQYVHMPYFQLPAIGTRAALSFVKGESAGPFGEDIPGAWMTADDLFKYLHEFGLGWKDVHARRLDLLHVEEQ